ncbi:MAG TPA: hypothetical protein DHU96_09030 [Actinobacteria bacterium]|nr:hypothetical protein [Actinomycetota bacterium]
MFRSFERWLYRPVTRRPRARRRRLSGCLLWLLIAIGIVVLLSLLFGGFQKGTRVSGTPTLVPAFHSGMPAAGASLT